MQTQVQVIHITAEGRIAFVWDDSMFEFSRFMAGRLQIARASEVEPDSNGYWWADLTSQGGPRLGPFELRCEAIAGEQQWLNENMQRVVIAENARE